jgi:CRISPR type I-E-associated protein CasB/Cse2
LPDPATGAVAAGHSALIGYLSSRVQRDDAAALSTLRRALVHLPAVPDARVWPYIVPYVGAHRAAQDTGLLTAGLFAAYHTAYTGVVHGDADLGAAYRRAAPREQHQTTYNALSYASWAGLPRLLIPVVDQCARARVALDWDRMQRDLRAWRDGYAGSVLRRWGTSLFHPPAHTLTLTPAESLT